MLEEKRSKMNFNIWTMITQSGFVVNAVLLSLFAASVVSWGIILKKIKTLRNARIHSNRFREIFDALEDFSKTAKESYAFPTSPVKEVFDEGWSELHKIQQKVGDGISLKKYFDKFGFSSLERGLEKGISMANTHLNDSLSVLASIGSISPFVGLFGTVWGIINSFEGLASGGNAIEAVAPGIAEALLATAVGLAAAIPAVWFYNYFNNKNAHINSTMEDFSRDFLNLAQRTYV